MPPLPRLAQAGFRLLILFLALARSAAGETPPLPCAAEALPPPPLRAGWESSGRPTVLLLPDHLGLDARAAFHAEALLARGLSVVAVALPPASGLGLGDRLRPQPRGSTEAAPALLPGLFALLRRLSAEGLPPTGGPRNAVGLLGFGEGGELALLAAQAALAPAAPRFRAHAALYPGCASRTLRAEREAGAPTTGAPMLLIVPHGGRAGDLPGGCARLYEPAGPADPVTLRAYDSLGYGFDLWPAIAWQSRDARFDPLRFDALRAELARRDIAEFFAAALETQGGIAGTGR